MRLLRSFSTRVVASTLVTATLTLGTLASLAVYRVDRNQEEQAAQVARLSEEKLAQRLFSDANLAAARLNALSDDVERRFAAIARAPDLARAVNGRNVVAISGVLGSARARADIDGVVAVDAEGRVIGAAALDTDLLAANAALRSSPLLASIQDLAANNDPERPRIVHQRFPLDATLAATLGTQAADTLTDVMLHPVFDEFGDVSALLVAHRRLKRREPILAEFAALTGTPVIVAVERGQISGAGLDDRSVQMDREPYRAGLDSAGAGRFVARCTLRYAGAEVCALARVEDLHLYWQQMVQVGEGQRRVLTEWLIGIAAGSLLLFAALSALLSGHVTRPLVRITAAVKAVAEGRWNETVSGLERPDEVGDIARAVEVLKVSLAERDRLRERIVRQNDTLVEHEIRLREQNTRFDAALNNMSQGLCMFSGTGQIIVSNKCFAALYGIGAVETGASHRAVLTDLARGLLAGPRLEAFLERCEAVVRARRPATFHQELDDGRTVAITHQPMSNGGWVETHEDITERKQAEARMRHMARHDALTSLPNRLFFRERLDEALAQHAAGGRQVAVLCLDLDGFKAVNDALGHPAGDELLRQAAQRLTATLAGSDTVARLGGDEFAVVQLSGDRPEAAVALGRRIIEALGQPYRLDGNEVVVGVSVGVAAVDEAADPDGLVKNADLALYQAKAEGRNTLRLFEPEMDAQAQARRLLERDLRQALGRGELELYYQPILHLATNRISGFEALLRWKHPERGFVSPGEFIPIAEEIGLINPIGEWVMRQACLEAMNWPEHMKVAVNVSGIQFRNRNLAQVVIAALSAAGLPATRLEIEVTESVLLQEGDVTMNTLHRLRALGVRLSMDDFGTGYSSLSCLRSFPFDKIKVDQSFVRDMLVRADCAAIIRTVADLGRSLRMVTTAEGVETADQLDQLRRDEIAEAQGYLISRPVPARDVAALIAREAPGMPRAA